MKIKNVLPYVKPSAQGVEKTDRGRTERAARSGAGGEARKPENEDRVELRTRKIIEEARTRLREVPEVREEKVAALREKIQSGNYEVPPEKVARAMLSDLLRNIY